MTTLFVDASAATAIIAREQWYEALEKQLLASDRRLYSALSAWETIVGLNRSCGHGLATARLLAETLFEELSFELVLIAERERRLAVEAFEQYGKGRGHRAQLNMGDCSAYACARTNGAKLLYKGDDVVHTDLA